jgi:hypothetical protein
MHNTISLPSTILNGFHSYIKWRILTHTNKLVARLQVEYCQRSCGYLYCDGPINGSLQSKDISYQSKDNYLSGISNGILSMVQGLTQQWQG